MPPVKGGGKKDGDKKDGGKKDAGKKDAGNKDPGLGGNKDGQIRTLARDPAHSTRSTPNTGGNKDGGNKNGGNKDGGGEGVAKSEIPPRKSKRWAVGALAPPRKDLGSKNHAAKIPDPGLGGKKDAGKKIQKVSNH